MPALETIDQRDSSTATGEYSLWLSGNDPDLSAIL
ncbi:MAG: hypothetical protein ACI9KN_000227 [Gammaproteobacteria bacterium]|jgi:hypothetical protein